MAAKDARSAHRQREMMPRIFRAFTKNCDSQRGAAHRAAAVACRLSLPADGLRILREDRRLEMAGNRLSYEPAALALSAGQ
jgi:hypothetical protein